MKFAGRCLLRASLWKNKRNKINIPRLPKLTKFWNKIALSFLPRTGHDHDRHQQAIRAHGFTFSIYLVRVLVYWRWTFLLSWLRKAKSCIMFNIEVFRLPQTNDRPLAFPARPRSSSFMCSCGCPRLTRREGMGRMLSTALKRSVIMVGAHWKGIPRIASTSEQDGSALMEIAPSRYASRSGLLCKNQFSWSHSHGRNRREM